VIGRVRVATIAASPDDEARVAQALSERPDVDLVMRCVDRVEALAVLRGGDIDAMAIIGEPHWFDAEVADEVLRSSTRLIAVGMRDGTSFAVRAADEVLPMDVSPTEIIRRCVTASTSSPPPPPPMQPSAPKGKVIAVWGPKGAPGRTTVALELAKQLAATEPSTLLIDADPYGGDLVQKVELVEETPTVVWAAQLAGRQRLDAGRVVTMLRRLGNGGPVLLPGLPRGDLWEEVSPFGWRQLLTVARALFTYTVCDVGFCLEAEGHALTPDRSERNMMTRSSLEAADRVVAVCKADVVGVKNFIWAYEALASLVDPDKVVVIANQVRDHERQPLGELLRKQIAKRPLVYLPRIDEGVRRFRSRSRDLQPNLRSLTASLGGAVETRGVLASLAGRH
jgi:Flp pilus assembly CpaE family ATPase